MGYRMEIVSSHSRSWCYSNAFLRRFAVLFTSVFISLLAIVVLTAGCAQFSSPEYQRPLTEEKAHWSEDTAIAAADRVIRPDWWRNFEDDYLVYLVVK